MKEDMRKVLQIMVFDNDYVDFEECIQLAFSEGMLSIIESFNSLPIAMKFKKIHFACNQYVRFLQKHGAANDSKAKWLLFEQVCIVFEYWNAAHIARENVSRHERDERQVAAILVKAKVQSIVDFRNKQKALTEPVVAESRKTPCPPGLTKQQASAYRVHQHAVIKHGASSKQAIKAEKKMRDAMDV